MSDNAEDRGAARTILARATLWLLLLFLGSGAVFLIVEPVLRLIGVRG